MRRDAMTDPIAFETPPDMPVAPAHALPPTGWQPMPPRARLLFLLDALPLAIPLAVPSFFAARFVDAIPGPLTIAIGLLAGLAFALGFGVRSHRYAAWTLDADGLAIRRGRAWFRETRVPANRVQHLDLKQGPIQRGRHLATLIVYTAGTRHAAVNVPHLDADDAHRLREVLARQGGPDGE